MTSMQALALLVLPLPFLIIFADRKYKEKQQTRLKANGGKAASHGNAAQTLQNENFRIRKTNREKGVIGELGVAADLEYLAQEYGLTVLHDLAIPGSKANIDHILISPKVVFVVDAKNYTGVVKVGAGKDGVKKLRVGGKDQTLLAEKLKTYANKVEAFLKSENVGVKVVPLLAFYKATFHDDSHLTINGVTVNIFGIENELLRYANLKSPSIDIGLVAEKILSEFQLKA
jgi:hypothetical protein